MQRMFYFGGSVIIFINVKNLMTCKQRINDLIVNRDHSRSTCLGYLSLYCQVFLGVQQLTRIINLSMESVSTVFLKMCFYGKYLKK